MYLLQWRRCRSVEAVGEHAELAFAGLLRQLRTDAKLTQEELAEAAGLSPRSISDLERGINRTARKETALLLVGALNIAEPVASQFISAARGRTPAAAVLAAVRAAASRAVSDGSAPAPGAWQECPYLGLVPFQEQDARIFYGRRDPAARLAHRLLERLNTPGILLLAGESGVGKSSLLRAGLMPLLAAGALGPGSARWPRRVIRPTGSPLRELAIQLADVAGSDPVSVFRSLSAVPHEAPMLAELAVRAAVGGDIDAGPGAPATASGAGPARLVLAVDQFEELFTASGDADTVRQQREAFVAALHSVATRPTGPQNLPPAMVIAAVRADFLGHLIAYPPLKAALDSGPFTVGPMSEAELRLAVTGPAAEAGLAVEPAVVEAVIAELRDEAGGGLGSGVLPLMSQAMAATWEHREGNELTLRAYRRAGGVADAVNRSAQAAYDSLTSGQKDAARLVFTQLTVVAPDGRLARRRCGRTDLRAPGAQMAGDVDAVIDIFSADRLLILGKDSVEISHDALLHSWKQLRDWLAGDQLDRALYSQLVLDAQAWDLNDRDSSYLYRPGRLATIDAAASRWHETPGRFPPLAAAAEAFLRAAHHAARRTARRRRAVIAGLAALSVTALSAAGIAVRDAGIAVRDAANASRQQTIALSRQLAAESLAVDSSDAMTARQLAAAAWRVYPTSQARTVMTALLSEQQQGGILVGDPSIHGVTSVAFSPNGKLLAGADAHTVRLWNPTTGQAIGTPLPADSPSGAGVYSAAFSPDGKLLASASGATVRLWNLATRQPIGAPLRAVAGPGTVNGVLFSPDGKLLATAGSDGTVRLWNPATGQPVGEPLVADAAAGGSVNAVAFSPDGKLLASADSDGTVRLWSRATGRPVAAPIYVVQGPGPVLGAGVLGVAFSPHGNLLASADMNGVARLWNPATGAPVGRPLRVGTGPRHAVLGVAFSPDGKLLATADANGNVRLWDTANRRPLASLLAAIGFRESVNAVTFSPDGTLLAAADEDGTVRLWNLATRRAPRAPLPADTGTGSALGAGVLGVAFSSDGKVLASADANDVVQMWNPATGQPVGTPVVAGTAARGSVNAVAFSHDGEQLATAVGGTVRLWNRDTGRPTGAPIHASIAGAVVLGVAFSPDGKLLAASSPVGHVMLWRLGTRQAAGILLAAHANVGGVRGVAFSPDGKLLATADADGIVLLWNAASGKAVGAPIAADTGPGGGVNGVAFSPDGKLLATAGADGIVLLWNVATGKAVGAPIAADTGPGGGVNGVAFSPDGKLLATADADGTVRLWQMALFADPYAALCADVGPPTRATWSKYAPGVPQPRVCI
jgi:WD40 repeat protein/DNA-binding XRE family transcriptional regulator